MNERIKQLAEQACFLNKDEESVQYFAELIVRECADQFRLVYTDEPYQRRIDKTILKHFGLYE